MFHWQTAVPKALRNGPTFTSRRSSVVLAPERRGCGVIAAPDLAQGVTTPAEQPHLRGSCPGQVRSKKTRLARVSTRDTILAAARSAAGFGSSPTCSVSVHG